MSEEHPKTNLELILQLTKQLGTSVSIALAVTVAFGYGLRQVYSDLKDASRENMELARLHAERAAGVESALLELAKQVENYAREVHQKQQ